MSTNTQPPVQKAMVRLQALSADSETQRLAEVRERALRDEAAFLETARNEGRAEGREEGKLESSLGIARRLLEQSGMDDATIARLTALEEDQVRRLRSLTDGK